MADLGSRIGEIETAAQLLKANATRLQEADVEGALSLTRQARERAQKAHDRVEFTQQPIGDSERQRRRTEALLTRVAPQLSESQEKNAEELIALGARLESMEQSLPDLNNQVCDGRGDPCDSLCGGGGCGKCGALSCDEGAVNKAESALKAAQEAEATLRNRQSESEEMMRGVRQAEEEANQSMMLANDALKAAESANNKSVTAKTHVDQLIIEMDKFLEASGASPADIQSLAKDVLSKSISLKPEQITDLARRINETIQSLTNIDYILLETADDLASANALKSRADEAKSAAQNILTVAQQVFDALKVAQEAQDQAQEAIETAESNINTAESYLTQIASETTDAHSTAKESVVEAESLRERLKELQRTLIKNDRDVKDAVRETDVAASRAQAASQGASELDTIYKRTLIALDDSAALGGSAHERSSRLQDKATRLSASITTKFTQLQEMEKEYMDHERRLNDLSGTVMALNVRMNDYLRVISERSDFYRTCQK